ncbi:hypothetical protein M3G50_07460 [Brachybacterium muris]|uniref:hypothetical protein n=1 Tax=Brachybacterium muris TaxID=219301 RepID=UPI0021A2FE5F|nr:hypothetical protein [Brachybacterium muris]MCT1430590.1 hypothetical protein [Brachybacterium muris]
MSTDEYVPSEQDLEVAWIESEASADDINAASAEFDRFLARVRRDAALTLAEHFSAEAIDQARQGNPDGADFYRAVATEIENQIPEEAP